MSMSHHSNSLIQSLNTVFKRHAEQIHIQKVADERTHLLLASLASAEPQGGAGYYSVLGAGTVGAYRPLTGIVLHLLPYMHLACMAFFFPRFRINLFFYSALFRTLIFASALPDDLE